MRYRIFCIDEHFLAPEDCPDQLEQDCFDAVSEHIVVRDNHSDTTAGSVRLVKYSNEFGFPTADHFPELYRKLSGFPLDKVYEISRLSISPFYRHKLVPKDGLYGRENYIERNNGQNQNLFAEHKNYPIILIFLTKAIYRLTVHMGGKFWIASMEPGLIRYLASFGMKCIHLSDDYINFGGKVIPCLWEVDKVIENISEKRPEIYEFFIHNRVVAKYY
jgi:N-acyl amino acid synthase of PEP-CTERM/exosortase system